MTTAEQRGAVAAGMSEDDLLANTVALAKALGWLVHHCRPARTDNGWRTPIQGTPGFPDLVILVGGWQIVAECKTQRGRLTTTQEQWRAAYEALAAVPGSRVRYFLWRPSDLLDQTIRRVLENPGGQT